MGAYGLQQHIFTTPKGHPARMTLRTDLAGNLSGFSDWNTVSSVMQPHDEYALAGLSLTGRAADIGSHIGSVAIALLLDNPDLFVIAVEPVPDNAALIHQNLADNNLTHRCQVWEGAVGKGRTTTIRFGASHDVSATHHAYIGNSSIVYKGTPDYPHQKATVPVFGPADFGALSFLKIDCEGGEWTFLERGIPDTERIVGEAHAVNGKQGRDIIAALPGYDVSLSGNAEGTCGFTAIRR